MGKVKGIDIPTGDPIQDNHRIPGKPLACLCRCTSHLRSRDDFCQSGSLTAGAEESQNFEVRSPEVGGLVEPAEVLEVHIASYHDAAALAAGQGLSSRNGRSYRCHLATEEAAQTTPILALQLTRMGLLARWGCPATSRLAPRAKRCLAALGGRSPGAIPGKLSGHLPSNSHVTFPFS